MEADVRLAIALGSALGMGSMTAGVLRLRRRQHMQLRLRALTVAWDDADSAADWRPARLTPRNFAGRLGARLGQRMPGQVGVLASRVDKAGLASSAATLELLGWKGLSVALGVAVGIWGIVGYGAFGLVILAGGALLGWFGIDIVLARYHSQ